MKNVLIILLVLICTAAYSQEMNYIEDNAAYWYLKAFESLPKFCRNDIKAISRIGAKEEFRQINPVIRGKLEAFDVQKFLEFTKTAKESSKHCYYNISDGLGNHNNIFFPEHFFEESIITLTGIAWKSLFYEKHEDAAGIYISCLDFTADLLQPDTTIYPAYAASKYATVLLVSISNAFGDNAAESFKSSVLAKLKEKQAIFSSINKKQIVENTYNLISKNIESIEKNTDEIARLASKQKAKENDNYPKCLRARKELCEAYDNYRANDDQDYAESNILKAVETLMGKGYLSLLNKNTPEYYSCPQKGTYTVITSKYFPTEIECSCETANLQDEEINRDYFEKTFKPEKEVILAYLQKINGLDHSAEPALAEVMAEDQEFKKKLDGSVLAEELAPTSYRYNVFLFCYNQCLSLFQMLQQ